MTKQVHKITILTKDGLMTSIDADEIINMRVGDEIEKVTVWKGPKGEHVGSKNT